MDAVTRRRLTLRGLFTMRSRDLPILDLWSLYDCLLAFKASLYVDTCGSGVVELCAVTFSEPRRMVGLDRTIRGTGLSGAGADKERIRRFRPGIFETP